MILNKAALAIALLATTPFSSFASGDMQTRGYVNLPTDVNWIAIAQSNIDAELYVQPGLTGLYKDVDIDMSGPLLGYTRTFELNGKMARFDAVGGYICGEVKATVFGSQPAKREFCGMMDPKVKLSWNFIGSKAMKVGEWLNAEKEFTLGVGATLSIPLGDYDKDYVVNVGENRWSIKPEIGMSLPFANNWELNAVANVKIFGDNHDLHLNPMYQQYLPENNQGALTYEQDELYTAHAHLVYFFNAGHWLSLDANTSTGGDSYTNGVKGYNKKPNSRIGITYKYPLTRQSAVKFTANTTTDTTHGTDGEAYGVQYEYLWLEK